MKHPLHLCLLFLLSVTGCRQEKPETLDLLIFNASVVDVTADKITPAQLIGIRGDRIALIADMAEADNFQAERTLDAENRYLLPGLWDMHVHFRGGDSLMAENRDLLPLFLAHGVTSVRDAGGDLVTAVMDWKEAIRNGSIHGPDIFTPGPKFDGPDPAWAGSVSLGSPEAVSRALDSVKQLEVDYLKTYDGSLHPEVYYELIRESESAGLKITGHMPLRADLLKAFDLGLDGIEHLYYLLAAASPLGDSLRATDLGYGMMPELLATYDPEKARQVFEKLGRREFYATPTLHIGSVLGGLRQNDHTADSLLAHIGPGIQKTYVRRVEAARKAGAAGDTLRRETGERFRKMIRPLHDAGVLLLAGSDCGPYNSFVYPGTSLLSELVQLVAAGLSPAEALQTSVVNGPHFFGLDDQFGEISKGKTAHLILLGGNPLEDISQIRNLYRVVKGSTIYNKGAVVTD